MPVISSKTYCSTGVSSTTRVQLGVEAATSAPPELYSRQGHRHRRRVPDAAASRGWAPVHRRHRDPRERLAGEGGVHGVGGDAEAVPGFRLSIDVSG